MAFPTTRCRRRDPRLLLLLRQSPASDLGVRHPISYSRARTRRRTVRPAILRT
jgi:hypothetical protein